eukprot:evm.model.scf_1088.2 EVM.evm.TU.scf_1088.2   scf_1088:8376-21349(-)
MVVQALLRASLREKATAAAVAESEASREWKEILGDGKTRSKKIDQESCTGARHTASQGQQSTGIIVHLDGLKRGTSLKDVGQKEPVKAAVHGQQKQPAHRNAKADDPIEQEDPSSDKAKGAVLTNTQKDKHKKPASGGAEAVEKKRKTNAQGKAPESGKAEGKASKKEQETTGGKKAKKAALKEQQQQPLSVQAKAGEQKQTREQEKASTGDKVQGNASKKLRREAADGKAKEVAVKDRREEAVSGRSRSSDSVKGQKEPEGKKTKGDAAKGQQKASASGKAKAVALKEQQEATPGKTKGSAQRVQSPMEQLMEELQGLKRSRDSEAVLTGDYKSIGPTDVALAAEKLGLHCEKYGYKREVVYVASKFPLPRYRPEFDPRFRQVHSVEVSEGTAGFVRMVLNTLKQNTLEHDWVEDQGDEGAVNGQVALNGVNGDRELNSGSQMLDLTEVEDAPPTGPSLPQLPDVPQAPLASENEPVDLMPQSLDNTIPNTPTETDVPTAASEAMRQKREEFLASVQGQQMMRMREELPAWKMKGKLLELIANNKVTVVSGATGCGKTTQLPQFILDAEIQAGRGASCSIICTQPRRVSALSVAQRVSEERGESVGGTVGYQIRLETEKSSRTRLLFCTSGVLLRKLMRDPNLDGVSHLVVDEIHERGMYEDFLLIVLRELLQRRSDLRLVLMSATLDAQLFSTYFDNCPTAHIPGFTHPVQELFLEDVLAATGYRIREVGHLDGNREWYQRAKFPENNPAVLGYNPDPAHFEKRSASILESIKVWASCTNEKLHLGALEAAVVHICRTQPPGGVLVFMTGWDDIAAMESILSMNHYIAHSKKVRVLTLHGNQPTVNQREIFEPPPPGMRKVVLATNIAETSITINDVVYVVNGGKAKEKSYDALNKVACLFPVWISQASCKQRRGRAGRVRPGVCYHMFPKPMHEDCMQEHQLPELQRTPLEELCLQIKSLGLGGITDFLSKAINPPPRQSIQNAISLLVSIGAMDAQENLTPLGQHLSRFPVEPCVGKMILMGAMFGCLHPVLTIASATAVKDPFIRTIQSRKDADKLKKNLSAGTRSDHVAVLRAFDGWSTERAKSQGAAWNYCRTNNLSYNSFEQMYSMRLQFAEYLADIGFLKCGRRAPGQRRTPSGRYSVESMEQAISGASRNASNLELLRAILCAGMFPSVARISGGRKPSFMTHDDGPVRPHPSSVNDDENRFPHRWLVYTDKVHTSGILFRSSSMVTDIALLLFGGELETEKEAGRFSMMNKLFRFKAKPHVAQMLVDLRGELQALLERKVRYPYIDLNKEGGSIVAAVLALLANEMEPYPEKGDEEKVIIELQSTEDDEYAVPSKRNGLLAA